MRSLTSVACAVVLLACGAPEPGSTRSVSQEARASTWVFTALDPPGSVSTFPTGIDDRGVVTFQYTDADWFVHGALLRAGVYTVIDVPGAEETLTGAPASDGRLPLAWVNWTEGDGRYHQALWDRGTITPLPDAPGWQHVSPSGMTANGVVCGVVYDADPFLGPGGLTGYVWDGTAFTFLDHPATDVAFTFVLGCNERGDVVGYYLRADGGPHAFLWNDGEWLDVAYPGAEATVAFSIGPSGAIAGTYGDVGDGAFGGGGHGFVLEHGRFLTLDYPGSLASFPTGINARGDVVGGWFDEAWNLHGYLAERR